MCLQCSGSCVEFNKLGLAFFCFITLGRIQLSKAQVRRNTGPNGRQAGPLKRTGLQVNFGKV
jgi:hypothetical protein